MGGRYGGDIRKNTRSQRSKQKPQVPAMEFLGRVVQALDCMTAPPSKRKPKEEVETQTTHERNSTADA